LNCKETPPVRAGFFIGWNLPNTRARISRYVDLAILTDLGNARNNVNVMSSNIIVACGLGGAGTVSEVALALKAK
jgi:predicted Rossmann-fold nucleotide-binding protein